MKITTSDIVSLLLIILLFTIANFPSEILSHFDTAQLTAFEIKSISWMNYPLVFCIGMFTMKLINASDKQ